MGLLTRIRQALFNSLSLWFTFESTAWKNLRVRGYDGSIPWQISGGKGDNWSNAYNSLMTQAVLYGFNGSNWDRWRNNVDVTLLPSAARTAGGAGGDVVNYNARGVSCLLNVTAASGTFAAGEGLSINLRGKDVLSGNYYLLTGSTTVLAATGSRNLLCYPGATDAGGAFDQQNDVPVPRVFRVEYGITGTNPSFTFSVGSTLIV